MDRAFGSGKSKYPVRNIRRRKKMVFVLNNRLSEFYRSIRQNVKYVIQFRFTSNFNRLKYNTKN